MALKDISSRAAILKAVAEYDTIGRTAFLKKYGFGRAREFYLIANGREYDSKAIVGAAHGYQFPDKGALSGRKFSGGEATVQPLLESLGFTMKVARSATTHGMGEPTASLIASDLGDPEPERIQTTVYRVLRDTAVALTVKGMHEYRCQVCGHAILLPNGLKYAEAHHIRPLGTPHYGPDIPGNVICVCPNHHAEFDYGVRSLTVEHLRAVAGHEIDPSFARYHNQKIYGNVRSTSRD